MLDSCVVDRFKHGQTDYTRGSRAGAGGNSNTAGRGDGHAWYFTAALLSLLVCCLSLVFVSGKRLLYRMFHVLAAVAWYYCSWILVAILKQIINDTSCGRHPNSVSGHYNFFTFAILSVLFLKLKFDSEQSEEGNRSGRRADRVTLMSAVFGIFYVLFIAGSMLSLWDTYFLGYHSLRQVVYGATLGLVSHGLFAFALAQVRDQSGVEKRQRRRNNGRNAGNRNGSFAIWTLCIGLIITSTALTLIYIGYTFQSGGYASFRRIAVQCFPSIVASVMCNILARCLHRKERSSP